MAGPKSAILSKNSRKCCTRSQSLLLAHWLYDFWDSAGFASMYSGEARRFMPRLLVGVCMAAIKEQPFTMTDAYFMMDAKHGKTTAKYVKMAIASGLIADERERPGDQRKVYLIPTKELLARFDEEMRNIATELVELMAALTDRNKLPPTQAAEIIEVRHRKKDQNRYLGLDTSPDLPFHDKKGLILSYGKPLRTRS